MDVEEQKSQTMELVLETVEESIFLTNGSGKIQWCNASFASLINQPKTSVVGKNIQNVSSLTKWLHQSIKQTLSSQKPYKTIYKWVSDRKTRILEIYAAYIKPSEIMQEKKGLIVVVLRDVTKAENHYQEFQKKNSMLASRAEELKKALAEVRATNENLKHLVRIDILTKLPNRFYFEETLKRKLAACKRGHAKILSLLLLDIDNFKLINTSLGQSSGDLLLQKFAARLLKNVREEDFVAKFGGDVFIIIAPEITSVELYAQRLLESLTKPVRLRNMPINITLSIGIATYPASGSTVKSLTKNAEIALHLAKEKEGNNFQIHHSGLNKRYLERLKLETHLRTALKKKLFFLLYQPIFDIQTKQIYAVEALLRLKFPNGKIVLPSQFIFFLEKTGLIVPVGEYVLKQACQQYVKWKAVHKTNFSICVNVSPLQLSLQFIDKVEKILHTTKMAAEDLVIEITESALMKYIDAQKILKKLKKLGVQISIDDFGTGHSSLSRLKEFPIDRIKLDKSFISSNLRSKNTITILKSIIELSQKFGMAVIAEGVETISQLQFLQKIECRYAQGYYFSKPLDPILLPKFLKKHL